MSDKRSSVNYDENRSTNNSINNPNIPRQTPHRSGSVGYSSVASKEGGTTPNRSFMNGFDQGEAVKVCLRIRPIMEHEIRGNANVVLNKVQNNSCHLMQNGAQREYTFSQVFESEIPQPDIFQHSGVTQLISSVLDGYSATVFAYGQTGSGKTYTMQGYEAVVDGRRDLMGDLGGIMPRSFDYIFKMIGQRQDKFNIKASYMEIYNEQIQDLLNPNSGVLQCRYHAKGGFYVNDLLVVEVMNVEDLIVILEEGQKNRKVGSHDLNSRSSRSHSILQLWLTSESQAVEGHYVKKIGKISFVDLAGSERLKESHSEGNMIKETGNINKSLFVLGKVITALTDRNKDIKPNYRDSKLTMLLQDSLGGSSLALMFACVSPVDLFADETLSTLNYASRVMNIKNKPVIQMGPKDQIIVNLKREIELYKMENKWLKVQLNRISGGEFEIESSAMRSSQNLPALHENDMNQGQEIQFDSNSRPGSKKNFQQPISSMSNTPSIGGGGGLNDKILKEFNFEIGRLRNDNNQFRTKNMYLNKTMMELIEENIKLVNRIENLENVFLRPDRQSESADVDLDNFNYDTMNGTPKPKNDEEKRHVSENNVLRTRINKLEKELIYFKSKEDEKIQDNEYNDNEKIQEQFNEERDRLHRKIDELQKREKNILQQLLKYQNANKK